MDLDVKDIDRKKINVGKKLENRILTKVNIYDTIWF